MIRMLVAANRVTPVVFCDVCARAITDASGAVAVRPTRTIRDPFLCEGDILEVLHVHKGACLAEAERRLGGWDATWWDELTAHLCGLMVNTGLPPMAEGWGQPGKLKEGV